MKQRQMKPGSGEFTDDTRAAEMAAAFKPLAEMGKKMKLNFEKWKAEVILTISRCSHGIPDERVLRGIDWNDWKTRYFDGEWSPEEVVCENQTELGCEP